MTEEELLVLGVKGLILELDEERRRGFYAVLAKIRNVLMESDPAYGVLAITLIGAEFQLKAVRGEM